MIENFLSNSLMQARPYGLDQTFVRTKLDQNESPWDWPEELKEKVLDRLRNLTWNRYHQPFAEELRAFAAKRYGFKEEEILLGPGSNYLVGLLMEALTQKKLGDVVVARPSFALYEAHAAYLGLVPKIWNLTDDLEYDLKLFPQLRPHSVVFFATPNNPVGNRLPNGSLETLLADHPTSYFVADEAYMEFADERLTDLKSRYPNLIIVRTFSKALGAAGVRAGYIVAEQSLRANIEKLRLPFMINVFTLAAMCTVLEDEQMFQTFERKSREIISMRPEFYQELHKISEHRNFRVKPSQTNFFLVKWKDQDSCQAAYRHLLYHDVLVRDVSRAPGLDGCLRVTIGTQDENRKFLDAMSKLPVYS